MVPVALDGSSPLLPPDRAAQLRRGARLDGATETDGTRYLYAARLVKGKGYILLRPASSTNSAWRPHIEGLVIAAAATAALAALIAFLLARAIARPVRRVAEATRGLATSTSEAALVPVEGARELALLAESFNEVAIALAKARRGGAGVPALGQPRAEDAADRDPRLRRRPRRRRPARRGDGGDDPPRVEPARAPRRRPARPRADEQGRVQRPARADRPGGDRAGGAAPVREPGARLRRRRSKPRRRHAPAIGDADRTLQIVSNLVENALRMTPAGGSVRIVTEPGSIRVEDTGPGLRARRARAGLRPLLPLLPLRARALGRNGARARDRQGARAGDGRERLRREHARAADGLHGAAAARRAARPPRRSRLASA